MPRNLTKEVLKKFSITYEEGKKLNLCDDDLVGITEISKNKKYRIFISNGYKRDGSRDRISETFDGSLIDAVKRRKELKESIQKNEIPQEARVKFEPFTKLYFEYIKEKYLNQQLSSTTYQNYYGIIKSRILPYFKNKNLLDITERDIETWIAKLGKTRTNTPNRDFLHPTTIAHAYKTLYNMFNFAKLERILKENPCDYVHKKPTEAPEEREYFTLEEMDYIKELLNTSNIRLKTAIYLLMDTGCRREEICGLKWSDVDFDNNTIDINKAVVSSYAQKELKIDRVRIKDVKTKNSKRKIGIPQVCINLLKQYRNYKVDLGLKVKKDDYIFTNWNDNKLLDPNRLTSDWLAFRKENNIKKKVTLHGLRHSNATFLLSTGMPAKDVAKRLGHTPEVLSRIYTHSNLEDDKKLLNILEEKFYGDKNKFKLESICSIIAGNINNEHELDNYKLLDFLTNKRISKDEVEKYLEPCKKYLLKKFPILEIFTFKDITENEKMFKDKIENFRSFIGDEPELDIPNEYVKSININI